MEPNTIPDPSPAGAGVFEARYLAFLETVRDLRPKLHRYCARMTGSVLDGEDVVQDALFQAYRRLDTYDDSRPLAPWLFRIAHNQCIDFLRRRDARRRAEEAVAAPDLVDAAEAIGPGVGRALEHLVVALPPKERACVLLKDVFGYSLEEIAELVDSTVGGVKAALNREERSSLAGPLACPRRRTKCGAAHRRQRPAQGTMRGLGWPRQSLEERMLIRAGLIAVGTAIAPLGMSEAQDKGPRVSAKEYEGWRQYSVHCARCHGQDVVGNPVAANLLQSAGEGGPFAGRDAFTKVVAEGRLDKGMPAFKEITSPEQRDAVYAYVKGRADKRIPAGRPTAPPS